MLARPWITLGSPPAAAPLSMGYPGGHITGYTPSEWGCALSLPVGELVLLRDCPKSDQNPESCPTSQPQILPAPQLSFLPSALTLSFCLSPSSSLPQPGFLIHSFPFITETHSCMGEKHLPAESGDRQRGRGVEGESKLEGACWGRSGSEGALPSLQEGLKPAGGRPQSLHPPGFQPWSPGSGGGIAAPLSRAVPKLASLLSAGERLPHTRGGLHWLGAQEAGVRHGGRGWAICTDRGQAPALGGKGLKFSKLKFPRPGMCRVPGLERKGSCLSCRGGVSRHPQD